VYYIIDIKNPLYSRDEALDRAVGSLESVVDASILAADEKHRALLRSKSSSGLLSKGLNIIEDGVFTLFDDGLQKLTFLKRPEFATAVLSAFYALYVAIAIWADVGNPSWGTDIFPPVTSLSTP
jgi:hypothetical protein